MAKNAVISKKPSKKFNQPKGWHAVHVTDAKGNKKYNCPCKGDPQPVSKRLQDRRDEVPPSKDKFFYHVPGSQNRKK